MTPDLKNDRDFGHFTIGRGSYWDTTTEFRAYVEQERVAVGRYCSLAAKVTINTGGEHTINTISTWPFDSFVRGLPNPTRSYRITPTTVIGNDVWIGFGAHVAKGVYVGDGAVIGARAVIVKDVPPYAIVVGNPARIIRYRFKPHQIAGLLAIAWWNWSPEQIAERIEDFYGPIDDFIARYGTPVPEEPEVPAPSIWRKLHMRLFRSRLD